MVCLEKFTDIRTVTAIRLRQAGKLLILLTYSKYGDHFRLNKEHHRSYGH